MKKIKYGLIILLLALSLLWIFYVPLLTIYSQSKNERALTEIKNKNAAAYPIFKAFIDDIEAKTDWHVLIVSGYRDEEKQAQLKKINPKNASAGKSKHNFGKAIDICVFRRKGLFTNWLVKSSPKTVWEMSKIPLIAKQHKLKWGGDFSNYHDPVHFEIAHLFLSEETPTNGF
jgi:D-alanyl-D-alanine carboxypeptidase